MTILLTALVGTYVGSMALQQGNRHHEIEVIKSQHRAVMYEQHTVDMKARQKEAMAALVAIPKVMPPVFDLGPDDIYPAGGVTCIKDYGC